MLALYRGSANFYITTDPISGREFIFPKAIWKSFPNSLYDSLNSSGLFQFQDKDIMEGHLNQDTPTRLVKTNYLVSDTDYFIVIDASLNPVSVTLPTITADSNRTFIIKAINITNTAKVVTLGTEQINGQDEYEFTTVHAYVEIVSLDTQWHIISKEGAEIVHYHKPTLRTITSDTVLTSFDDDIICDGSGGNIVLTLPAANSINRVDGIKLKVLNLGQNYVKVLPSGSDTIEGDVELIITMNKVALEFITDNVSNWNLF